MSVHGWTFAFLLAVHRLCGVIEGRLGHFLPRWLKTGWQRVWSADHSLCQSLEILHHGRELNPNMERTDSEIHSFSHWAIMTRATERTDSEIHSFSHWAIMTRATERTDSEIHSFSHWAIMTRATERTDSEIQSFSHWAIMTRATERTDREIHLFSHWAIMADWT